MKHLVQYIILVATFVLTGTVTGVCNAFDLDGDVSAFQSENDVEQTVDRSLSDFGGRTCGITNPDFSQIQVPVAKSLIRRFADYDASLLKGRLDYQITIFLKHGRFIDPVSYYIFTLHKIIV